jgi:hypothetical protein
MAHSSRELGKEGCGPGEVTSLRLEKGDIAAGNKGKRKMMSD